MLLTIVPKDNAVTKDGRTCVFDLSKYASLEGLHSVQWIEDSGHIEYENFGASATTFKPNEQITDISPYQDIIDAWQDQADLEDNTIVVPPTDPTELPPPINEMFCLFMANEEVDVADFSGTVED